MSSVLSTGTSALLAFQRALATTSHNVANLNTPGYSRQKVDFATATPQNYGYGDVGNGTRIVDIRRAADQLAISRLLDSGGELARLKQLSGMADRVNALFSDAATNVAGVWSNFFDTVSGLSSNAAGTADRQNMLDGAKALANRFSQLNTHLNNLNGEVNNGLMAGATEVNRLASEIAQINGAIGTNIANAAPDLLDRRDQLISQLVGYTGGTAVIQDGGIMNVYTAGGQALVVGTTASKVTTVADPYQPERLQLALQTQGGTITLDPKAVGGQIGGLLEFRDTVLTPAQAELGKLAVGLAETFNSTHRQGVDLYGQMGGDFFNIGTPRVTGNAGNTGTGAITASYGDLGKLEAQNIVLKFDGSNWAASRADTGASVPLTGTGTAADPLIINGVKLVVGGAPAANDRFLLQPTAGVAGSLEMAITDPSRIAAAAAIKGAAALANTGTGKLSGVTVTDAANANLRNPAAIVFTSATTYTIDGGPPQTYTPGQTISANGWSFVLDGVPKNGDTFNITPTPAGSSDNSNATKLSKVESAKAFNAGTVTLGGALGGLTTQVGAAARSAEYSLGAQQVIADQAQAARDEVSGVNLDEEAADMLRLQQAYQAASQLISTADSMFQTILGAVRR
ncbi:flagellar hook-associated protein FlgK [Stenotrophomonas indicatrix]|jgi:flagellar hook-associated protein 1 FlgK|uniref:flagellar hook-associated protein FlgK n=1 Tax=Stenotrophomonas TaxID=40323 RepID=UPI000470DCE8|nr:MULTISPECIES: flagellar hook-associated protein FlgK [Stenotrophomonas]OJH79622.1 MAG: flagellar hook-associated protein FlgK [Stenotrophomonas maltophilia]MBA0098818.1 flagellar hook-associated protein FlgK [Stenotrophomonas indicatrix]MDF2480123.1 flagellar hook-associated protein FlgK [Stenotrophomonas indicatrix]MDH6329559.1 flagellar hook-associated protein 1 FlgK [Stenotrophomonas sp. 1278]MDR6693173.1 flagellar hook-associated protein 1 FlgK [Stenotrophomonas sp. 1337]